MSSQASDIIHRADRLQQERSGWISAWDQIREYVIPVATPVGSAMAAGGNLHGSVLDNTAEGAHQMLAGALVSILTPAAGDWFVLATKDADLDRNQEVRLWLEQATAIMLRVFRAPAGGFSRVQHEKYAAVTGYGTGASYIAERPGKGIVWTSVPLRQLLLAEDADGAVDTVYRDFSLTARQCLQLWPQSASPRMREMAVRPGQSEDGFRIIHAVYPRTDRDADRKDKQNLPFASVYVSADDGHILHEGGYHEMPYQTPRWYKLAGEVYGRGPGHAALPDVKSLQRGMHINFAGAELVMRPPLMVADDGIIGNVRMTPGGINYYRAGAWAQDPIRPLMTGARPDLGEDLLAGIRERIESAFMKPLVQMIRKDRMTATEVMAVMEEGQRILGPYIARLESEDLGPTVERVFGLLLRAGAIGQPPAALQGRTVSVDYGNPAAKAQRISRARGLGQYMDLISPLVNMDPALLDNLDKDTVSRDMADILGLPQAWLRPVRDVAADREGRASAQAAQMQMQQASAAVDMAAKAAPVLQAAGGGNA